MTAILKNLSKLFFWANLFNSHFLFGQQQGCNRETYLPSFQAKIPKEVCIREGLVIRHLYGQNIPIDFNQDGLNDFIFLATKRTKSLGDTSYLIFYKMNFDSTFTFFKQFDNIFPVYFNPNEEFPKINNPLLEKLFACYTIPKPLNNIEIKNDTIQLTIDLDGHRFQSVIYLYKYSSKFNDWKLVKKNLYTHRINTQGEEIIEKESQNFEKNALLSSFSYCEEE